MKRLFRFFLRFVIWFFVITIGWVVVLRFVPVYFTPLMAIRAVEYITTGQKPVCHHYWVRSEQMSDNIKRAVIASEDQLFFQHKGFDRVQIKKAIEENKTRKRPRGASTISQQTAKNVFLWPHSSWLRKGLEVYFTVLIELVWGKERILEVYLNSIETGVGLYGAEAVARVHFKTTSANLDVNQAALIAATLPNPRRHSSKEPSAYMRSRQGRIIVQMRTIKLEK